MAAQDMAEGSQSNSKLPSAVLDASHRFAANQFFHPGVRSLQCCCFICSLTLQVVCKQSKCDPMYPVNSITVKITQLRQHRALSVLLLWFKSCSGQMAVTDSSYIMLYMHRTNLLQAYLLKDG